MSIEQHPEIDVSADLIRMQNRVAGLGHIRELFCPDGEIHFEQDITYGNPAIREEKFIGELGAKELSHIVGDSISWLGYFGEEEFSFSHDREQRIVSRVVATDLDRASLGTDVIPNGDGTILLLNMKFVDYANRSTIRFCVDADDTFSFRLSYTDKNGRHLAYQTVTDFAKDDQKVPVLGMTQEEFNVITHYIGKTREFLENKAAFIR